MTEMQPWGNSGVAVPEGFDDGLGDFDETDAAVPRLTIVHKEAMFKESLSGTKYEALDLIILGLVKQRTLWSTDVDEGEKPMCKSPDFENGFPTVDLKLSRDKQYPWEKTPFSPTDHTDADGVIKLPCNSCPLKEWKSHPNGKTPWCSEEFTLPVLYDMSGEGDFVPALITIKKSGLKNLKAYLASFQRQRMPAFSVVTRVTLKAESRGQTDYAVPQWAAGDKTQGNEWEGFSSTYKGLREFLHAPPARYDEDGNRIESAGTSSASAPVQQATVAPQQAAQPTAPQQAAPAKPASAAPVSAAPATTAPVTEDVVDAEIVEEPPVAQAAPTAPVSTAPVASQPAAAPADEDELPF